MAIIKTIKNALGILVYPITLTKAIYDDNNVRLDTKLSSMDKSITDNTSKEEILERQLAGLTFAQDTKGNWGYKPKGADTVIPFKKGEEYVEVSKTFRIDCENGDEINVEFVFPELTSIAGVVSVSGISKYSSANYHVRINDLRLTGNKILASVGSYHGSYRNFVVKVIGKE